MGIRRVMSHVDAVARGEYIKDSLGTSPPSHPTGGMARAPEKKNVLYLALRIFWLGNKYNFVKIKNHYAYSHHIHQGSHKRICMVVLHGFFDLIPLSRIQ